MTAVVRAGVIVLGIAAVALSVGSTGHAFSGRLADRIGTATPARMWAGYPMERALRRHFLADSHGTRDITTVGSLNWAGYAVSRPRTSFRSIRATFFVPYLDCTKGPGGTFSSDWVGLDGFVRGADSVEQIGISADCSAAGKASYRAWFEMFPLPEARAAITVRAGDSVTASVSYLPADKRFRLTIADNTRGTHFSSQQRCPQIRIGRRRVTCPHNSAEAISEAPAMGSSRHVVITRLADYGAVSFAGISVTDGAGIGGGLVSRHWGTSKIIEQRPSGGTIALPTPTEATTFDTYWLAES